MKKKKTYFLYFLSYCDFLLHFNKRKFILFLIASEKNEFFSFRLFDSPSGSIDVPSPVGNMCVCTHAQTNKRRKASPVGMNRRKEGLEDFATRVFLYAKKVHFSGP